MNCGVCVYLLELCLLFIVPIILVVACVAGRFNVIAGTCNGRILAFLYQLARRWQRWLLFVVIFLICPVAVNLMNRNDTRKAMRNGENMDFWRNPLLSARCQWPWYNNRIPLSMKPRFLVVLLFLSSTIREMDAVSSPRLVHWQRFAGSGTILGNTRRVGALVGTYLPNFSCCNADWLFIFLCESQKLLRKWSFIDYTKHIHTTFYVNRSATGSPSPIWHNSTVARNCNRNALTVAPNHRKCSD